VSKRSFFSSQLAKSLVQVNWHYKTLLAICIESVRNLPDDIDRLIDELLLRYPDKPSEKLISQFLQTSSRVSSWFRLNPNAPQITLFNLDSSTFAEQESTQHPIIHTVKELADWLDISASELSWYANSWRYDSSASDRLQHYCYQILCKTDGRRRLIEKPKPTLKRLQRKIYQQLLSTLNPHPAAHGFCKGSSCLSHASVHVGKHYVFMFDITECFQSIRWSQVKSVFNNMGYPDAVSTHLTALCTHRARLHSSELHHFEPAQQDRFKQRHLPQGAPSSPALANAVLHQLDVRLTGLAKSLCMQYSRYADDIVFSGNRHRDWRFLEPLIGSICLEEGVCLNHKKSRIKKSHQKQRVVGIVVNSKPNVDRAYFDTLKATLTNCVRHGLESQNRAGHPQYRAHLLGQIQYVKSLNKQRGNKLERIYRDIEAAQ